MLSERMATNTAGCRPEGRVGAVPVRSVSVRCRSGSLPSGVSFSEDAVGSAAMKRATFFGKPTGTAAGGGGAGRAGKGAVGDPALLGASDTEDELATSGGAGLDAPVEPEGAGSAVGEPAPAAGATQNRLLHHGHVA